VNDDVKPDSDGAESDSRNRTSELFQRVYEELRRVAKLRMGGESSGITLQPTALVHETYVRLTQSPGSESWTSTEHFVAVAADVMRHVLVDNARRRKRKKRGGDQKRVNVELESIGSELGDDRLMELDAALDELAELDPIKSRLVVLRYFGGMTIEQACEVLKISRTTAHRNWTFARAWLFRRLGDTGIE
jgi:RNA polymerase sigma factor (TIGR02999 family)